MHVLLTVIIGSFVGAVAKMLLPGRDPGGFLVTILLGIAGAALAGFVGRSFGLYHAGATGAGVLASIIGAVVILALYRVLSPRKMARP
jgi:uncharacterized membrane protein YeaQ/YmgE (transglycosylase-associated protein family)